VLGLMDNSGPDDRNLYLGMDERDFRIVIVPGSENRFQLAGWELPDKCSFDSVTEELSASGFEVDRCGKDHALQRNVTECARTTDPAGNQLELYYGRIQTYRRFISPQGVTGFVTGNMGLGHVVLPTPNLAACLEFYTGILGFKPTDYMDVELAPGSPTLGLHFLHCDNPRHHSLALFETQHPAGLIHMMLEVDSIDEVGYALDRCHKHDIHITASLGRHVNDRMISFYMRCPSGFEIEYGCEGWQVDWASFIPTNSRLQSFWGHKFIFPSKFD
jgi:3,4-dihydroxy-9,10-secoandrosta-1,3,5(10)-triene-9,17-dione 4,5-dioxygenase